MAQKRKKDKKTKQSVSSDGNKSLIRTPTSRLASIGNQAPDFSFFCFSRVAFAVFFDCAADTDVAITQITACCCFSIHVPQTSLAIIASRLCRSASINLEVRPSGSGNRHPVCLGGSTEVEFSNVDMFIGHVTLWRWRPRASTSLENLCDIMLQFLCNTVGCQNLCLFF